MDCGVACVSMIALNYGKQYDLNYLRKLCYTTREGVSLLGISDTLELIGFKTIGGKLTFNKLEKSAILPCIVH